MRVITQPCASPESTKHYENTINNQQLTLNTIKEFLNPDDYNNLYQIYGKDHIKIWGVTKSSENKWNKVQMGDIVLFAANKRIFTIATVTYKMKNPSLAKQLWGQDEKNNTWENIYFIDEITNVNIPYTVFNQIVGYDSKYIIQGFNILSVEKSTQFLNAFDIESSRYIDESLTNEEYEKLISNQRKPHFENGLNIEQKSFRRAEQGFLRRKLFGNKFIGVCAICGKELPIEFLWCAHIKKRSNCTEEELLDFDNIVVPMCKLGCDELFERGFLGVDNGLITIIKKTNNKVLDEYMKHLSGIKCVHSKKGNERYFKYHLDENK